MMTAKWSGVCQVNEAAPVEEAGCVEERRRSRRRGARLDYSCVEGGGSGMIKQMMHKGYRAWRGTGKRAARAQERSCAAHDREAASCWLPSSPNQFERGFWHAAAAGPTPSHTTRPHAQYVLTCKPSYSLTLYTMQ